VPSKYLFTFYDGRKITDEKRGKLTFRNFPNTSIGQLGDEVNNPNSDDYVWYVGTGSADALGVLKGRTAGLPIFLASETYFLLAEAALYGHELSGSASANFEKGILASFTYLEKNATNALAAGQVPANDAANYKTENSTNYLVNYALATTTAQRLEAIITQKYIALNFFMVMRPGTNFAVLDIQKLSMVRKLPQKHLHRSNRVHPARINFQYAIFIHRLK
jgi:hypothetical protein